MYKDTGIVFGQEAPFTSPDQFYDVSRYRNVCTSSNMTYVLQDSGLYAASFNGTNSKVACGNIGNGKSISFWIKLDTTTEAIMEESAASGIEASSGTLAYTAWDNAYVNAVDTDTITTEWSHVVIVSTTNIAMSAFTIGLLDTTYLDGEIALLKVYDYVLSAGQVVQDYESLKHWFGIF